MICPTCGEQVDDLATECPYCETALEPVTKEWRTGMATVNLEERQPTVDQARDRLEVAIKSHRMRDTEGLLLIHGYGSSGEGGAIKEMVHQRLAELRDRGEIRDFVPGEEVGRAARRRLPQSFTQKKAERENPGITIVLL